MKPLLRLLFLVILLYILYNLAAELSFNAEEATALDVEESRKAKIRVRQPLEDKKLSNDSPKKTFEPVRVPIVFENKKKVLIYSATKFFKMDVTTERFLGNCFSTMGYCRISENPADYEKADAVLFHSADYRQGNVPKNRRPGVPHVLWSLESQANDRFRPEPGLFAQYLKRWLLDVINWTMTPLKHSDIWYPYGHCEERPEAIELDLDEIWNMKTEKTAVWLASNCFTVNRRKDIINSLVSFGVDFKFKDPKFDPCRGPIKACIFPRTADLFGACGRPAPDCAGVHMQGYDCVKTLVRKYKFYFSIENSNCKDYVTEKFWAALGERYAVPIILERKKYEAVGAPPNSFIAIDDFKNLKEVAEHIKKVAANKEEYLKYHKWRNTHQVFPEHDDATGFCELCRVLQTPPYKKNSYHDIAKFQSPQEQCNQDYANRFF